MRSSRLLAVLALAALAPAAAEAAGPAVTPADIDAHARALADIAAANGGNRAAGLPGGAATADHVAAHLAAAGWQVRRQRLTVPFFAERSAPVLGDLRHGRDFVTARMSASGDATGRVRRITGVRCSARTLRPLRRGEIAVVPDLACSAAQAARLVRARGGAGLLYDGGGDAYPLRPALEEAVAVPVMVVRSGALARLVRARARVRLRVDATIERRAVENVVGELPGGSRVVMAGAHLDSVPESPGINDNGSGIAALLEVAERLPAEPRAGTVRLGFWTGEEYGLYGSTAYVRSLPAAERRRFAAYLNLDMVGSPNPAVEVYDSGDRIEAVLRDALPGREGETTIAEDSDHAPFAAAGIPVGGVYTGATERTRGRPRDRCYHRACDGVDNLDRATAATVATAVERAIVRLTRR